MHFIYVVRLPNLNVTIGNVYLKHNKIRSISNCDNNNNNSISMNILLVITMTHLI